MKLALWVKVSALFPIPICQGLRISSRLPGLAIVPAKAGNILNAPAGGDVYSRLNNMYCITCTFVKVPEGPWES